jgi:hypothetical protein
LAAPCCVPKARGRRCIGRLRWRFIGRSCIWRGSHISRSILFILSTGYILFFFSERLFWAQPRAGDALPDYLFTWLAYAFLAFGFISTLILFRVHNIWGLFLCGAIFGWLAEGVVVQTMYESFPLQISWTGLAWHALITVWAGWFGGQWALARPRWALGMFAVLGLFWGLWGAWWWTNEPGVVTHPLDFAGHALATSAALALAYAVAGRTFRADFRPNKWAILLYGLFLVGLFLVGSLRLYPWAAIILPPLLLLTLWALWRGRNVALPGSLLDEVVRPYSLPVYASFLVMPVIASAVYGLLWVLQWSPPTGYILYAVTMPGGFILWGVSWWNLMRTPHKTINRETC